MKTEGFEGLLESVRDAGKILHGETKATREFTIEVETSNLKKPLETWAICITNEDDSLICGKVYQVKTLDDGFWVRDENGESMLCPNDFFVPIDLPQTVQTKLVQTLTLAEIV